MFVKAHEQLQAATLNVVGVKHLFIVPRLRASNYVRTLAEAFAEMRGAQPGDIQIQDLPELRNIVLVDNAEEARDDLAKLHIRSMVDWREILMWRQDGHEAKLQQKLYEGLDKDETINLQFTRYDYWIIEFCLGTETGLVGQRDYRRLFL